MECLDLDVLHQASLGLLDAETRARVDAHVEGCQTCRRVLAEATRLNRSGTPEPTLTLTEAGTPVALAAGATFGRYLLLSPLGRGAASEVFVAYDPSLDRKVALKLMRLGSRSPERALEEARLVAQLKHPHIVDVFDVGVTGEWVFVAMELAPHGSARAWVASARPPWRQVVAIYLDAAKGLAHAHAASVLHLDVKPDNVLVLEGPRGAMGDFGLARRVAGPPSAGSPPVGTPAYIAPEQYRGEGVGVRADQFSFCASLWEALTGERPFGGATRAELERNIAGGQRRPFPELGVSRAVVRALERGLSAQAADRFDSVAEVCAALEQAAKKPRVLPKVVALLTLLAAGAVATVELRRPAACVGEVGDGVEAAMLERAEKSVAFSDLRTATWRQVEPILRVYAARLRQASVDACIARGPFGDPAAVAWDKATCLAERRAAYESLLTCTEEAGVALVLTLREAAVGLGPPEACGAPAAVRVPPAAERAAVAALRIEEARVRVLTQLGFWGQANHRAGQLLTSAATLKFAPARAEALQTVGEAQVAVGTWDVAERTAREALEASAGDDAATARALELLARSRLGAGKVGEETAPALERARGLVRREPALERRIALTRAQLLDARAQWDEASAAYADALALEAKGPLDPYFRAQALRLSAVLASEHGDFERALPLAEQAVALTRALSGTHPDTADALSVLGTVEEGLNRRTAALEHHREAVAMYALSPLPGTVASVQAQVQWVSALVGARDASAVTEVAPVVAHLNDDTLWANTARAGANVAVAEAFAAADAGDSRVRLFGEQALDAFTAAGPRYARERARAEALLAGTVPGCVPRPGSLEPTPAIDEDCDGQLDNVRAGWRWQAVDEKPRTVVSNGCAPLVLGTTGGACARPGCPHYGCWVDEQGQVMPICPGEGFGKRSLPRGKALCTEVPLHY